MSKRKNRADSIIRTNSIIENTSRKEHGKTVLLADSRGNSLARVDSRDVSLIFTVQGDTEADFKEKRDAFYQVLYNGAIELSVPKESENIYYLVYKGKGNSYSQNRARTFCKFAAKFEEPNPNNRK